MPYRGRGFLDLTNIRWHQTIRVLFGLSAYTLFHLYREHIRLNKRFLESTILRDRQDPKLRQNYYTYDRVLREAEVDLQDVTQQHMHDTGLNVRYLVHGKGLKAFSIYSYTWLSGLFDRPNAVYCVFPELSEHTFTETSNINSIEVNHPYKKGHMVLNSDSTPKELDVSTDLVRYQAASLINWSLTQGQYNGLLVMAFGYAFAEPGRNWALSKRPILYVLSTSAISVILGLSIGYLLLVKFREHSKVTLSKHEWWSWLWTGKSVTKSLWCDDYYNVSLASMPYYVFPILHSQHLYKKYSQSAEEFFLKLEESYKLLDSGKRDDQYSTIEERCRGGLI